MAVFRQVYGMSEWRARSTAEQLADFLKAELARSRWTERMPGVHQLCGELGVHRQTAELALRELERTGWLEPQGVGRRRKITGSGQMAPRGLRVGVLLSEAADRRSIIIHHLELALREAGYSVVFPNSTLSDLRMDVGRIAKMVGQTNVDAWIVEAGSREVLDWFASCGRPTMALFGRFRRIKIAGVGPDKIEAYLEATRALVGLGHRRIVMLVRPRRRLPSPGKLEQAYLDELVAHRIRVGDFHLASWDETVDGFHARLAELFRLTAPTALWLDESPMLMAAMQFLGGRGLRVPGDVSILCTDAEPMFDWCRPTVAHIRWESAPVIRRVVRWVNQVARGVCGTRHSFTVARFVPGGTLGPVAR